MKQRFSEEHIIKAIELHKAEVKVYDICRDMGISSGTYCNWQINMQDLK